MNRLKMEQIVSVAAVALVAFGCMVVLRPFITALLWAAILCFSTWPLFVRLEAALKGRRTLASSIMVLGIALLLVAPFVIAGTQLADNFRTAIEWIREAKVNGLPPPPDWIKQLPMVGKPLAEQWAGLSADTGALMEKVRELLEKSQGWLVRNGIVVLGGIAQLCFSVLIAFFLYRDGDSVVRMLVEGIRRIAGDDTQNLINIVGGTVKGVVYGILCTALAQGVLAGIGFTIAGIPSSLLLGFLTFVLAFVPGGPPFVWLPVAGWLFLSGNVGWGIFMLLWGFLVVSGVDNFLRPYFISRDSKQSFALILLGVLGGLLAFGFIGLFLGPTLLAIGSTLVKQFIARKREARSAESTSG